MAWVQVANKSEGALQVDLKIRDEAAWIA